MPDRSELEKSLCVGETMALKKYGPVIALKQKKSYV